MAKLFSGAEAQYEPETCPERGKLLFWPRLDGRHGDAQTLYCKLCGIAIKREPYPEEARIHPK